VRRPDDPDRAPSPTAGTAARQGRLWGARADDWAGQEAQEGPRYDEALSRLGIEPGQVVLEVGCGSGVFLAKAAERGARVFGLDAAEALIEIARKRVPEADLRVGDLQALPYRDDSFDVVAGFNSFFFAADMTAALREARRVAKPGAAVVIQVWGPPERCDLTPAVRALRALRPAPGAGARAPMPLWEPGVLEEIAADAGLTPRTAFDCRFALEYPDEPTLVRRLLSPGGAVEAIEAAGEEAVAKAIVGALRSHRTASGGYRLENEWHYLVASS
jgi:SAM-dependent methyltransferase